MENEMHIMQTVAILIDGNNMDKSANTLNELLMMNYDTLVPRLIGRRSLSRLFYLREGKSISKKLADRLHNKFYGIVKPCHKSADVPLTIEAVQLVDKVDTIIIFSGDSDYIELVKYLSARGCRTEIAAFKFSASAALIEAADFYHEITTDDCYLTDKLPKDHIKEPSKNKDRQKKNYKHKAIDNNTDEIVVNEPVLPKPSIVYPEPVVEKPIEDAAAPVKPEKKKRKVNVVPTDTYVVDTNNPEVFGTVVSYNQKNKMYTMQLDSGSQTKWRRNAFDIVLTAETNKQS